MDLVNKAQTAFKILRSRGFSGLIRTIRRKTEARTQTRKRKQVHTKEALSDRFSEIYRLDYWKTSANPESASGSGSTKERAALYLEELGVLLDSKSRELKRPVRFFDAPCGDLNWIHSIFKKDWIDYHGADIVPTLIALNKEKFADQDIQLSVFDITKDRFPECDIWHCRDCFFHLSYDNIFRSLETFAQSNVPFALFTSHVMDSGFRNRNIEDGDFRFLDLTKAPFHFPEPQEILNDGGGSKNDPTRIIGLYTRDTVSSLLNNRQSSAGIREAGIVT